MIFLNNRDKASMFLHIRTYIYSVLHNQFRRVRDFTVHAIVTTQYNNMTQASYLLPLNAKPECKRFQYM